MSSQRKKKIIQIKTMFNEIFYIEPKSPKFMNKNLVDKLVNMLYKNTITSSIN